MGQFFAEFENENREAIFGALSSYLRGNIDGKKSFYDN